ncbi:MAG: tripartite tricarboxylate transporter substrate binding protein [Pseudomonadota bacterium]|nr:tripartite tricarboxylate transporter substrate binding protein [Pseudomonadota bacterium]
MHTPKTLTRRHGLALLVASGLVPLLAAPAHAQAAYPSGPIKFVVPFPPGGLLDNVARIVEPKFSAALGQPVVIDNRPGSGGNIGAAAVAKSPANGLTWLLASPGLAISPALYAKLPYELGELAPVALLGSLPNVLLVPASSPYQTVQALIDAMRQQPDKLSYASNGNGTSLHLSAELLKSRTQTQALHVAYRGTGPATTAILAGDVQFMFHNLPPALSLVQSGKLRALAVTSTSRAPALPDVPTLQEAGVADFDVTAWFGVMVPRATPAPVQQRLQDESRKVVADAAVAEALRKQGIEPGFQDASVFAAHLAREVKQWQTLVQQAGIKLE